METISICEVCGVTLDSRDYQVAAHKVSHMGKTVTTCFDCKTKPLCVANPDGPHGEIVGTDEPKFDPENMEIGPLPDDRIFGYCVKCLLPWEWFPERRDWEPLTWGRLSYLWAERSSGALDLDDREAVDVRVTAVSVPEAPFITGHNVAIALTLTELCDQCGNRGAVVAPESFVGVRPCNHEGLRSWRLENTTPLAPDSELMQLARAWGVKEGTEFDPEDLQGFSCKMEILNGAIMRVL